MVGIKPPEFHVTFSFILRQTDAHTQKVRDKCSRTDKRLMKGMAEIYQQYAKCLEVKLETERESGCRNT